MNLSRNRRATLVVALAAIGVALALAPFASANHLLPEMSVSAGGSARLVNGVYLTVPVTVACPDLALDANHFVQAEDITVNVIQKVSKDLAEGSGSMSYSDERVFGGTMRGTPIACDGTPHTYVLNVFPRADSPPFRGGKAVVLANFDIFIQNLLTFGGDDNRLNGQPESLSIKG